MKPHRRWIACVLSALVLTGVYLEHSTLHALAHNADGYHAKVIEASSQLPFAVGGWLGTAQDIPDGAKSLLRPNLTLSRQFSNVAGEKADFLLVQCRDARDLLGHYPPVCYTAHGFELVSRELRDWDVDGETIHGTIYEFRRTERQDRMSTLKVYDTMVLPNGTTAPDMAGVDRVARQRAQRYYGAAHIQILTDASLAEEKRTEVIGLLLRGAVPVIKAIREGVPQ
jgi:hypothetical protein